MSKRVFYVSSGRLSAYTWQSGGVSDPIWFSADEHGLAEFSRYLESVPNDPVRVEARRALRADTARVPIGLQELIFLVDNPITVGIYLHLGSACSCAWIS